MERPSALAREPAFSLLFIIAGLHLCFSPVLQQLQQGLGLILSFALFFVLPLFTLCALHRLPTQELLGLRRVESSLLLFAIAIALANFGVAGALQSLTEHLLPEHLISPFDYGALLAGTAFEQGAVILSIFVAAPVAEELLFRGYLQSIFRARGGALFAVLLCALLFSAIHFELSGSIARIELGLIFGLLALWSRSIWPAIVAHATNNGTAILLLYSGTGEQADGGALRAAEGWSSPLGAAAVGAVLTLGLLFLFRRRAALARAKE